MAPQTGLGEFREVVSDFRSVTSWTLNGTVVAPLADIALHLGAPWPSGVPIITSIVELTTVVAAFHFWSRDTQVQLTRRIRIMLVLLCFSFFSYLYLFDTYTFVNPATSKRYAKGFVVRPEIQELIPQHFKTAEDALRGSEYVAEDIWERRSITNVRLLLLVDWLLMFVALSGFIGTFVMAQRRRAARKPTGRRP